MEVIIKNYIVTCLARSTKSFSRNYIIQAKSKTDAEHKALALAKLDDFKDEDLDSEEFEPEIEISTVYPEEEVVEGKI